MNRKESYLLSPSMKAQTIDQILVTKGSKTSFAFFFTLFFLLAMSRGLLEFVILKKFSMILQFGGLIAIGVFLFFPGKNWLQPKQKPLFFFLLVFVADSYLSSVYTTYLDSTMIWLIYLCFNFGLLFLALFMVRDFSPSSLSWNTPGLIISFSWLFFLVSVLEQLHIIDMHGSGRMYVIRPASTTGSMLHYPIVIALFSILCLEWGRIAKKKFYSFSGIIFSLSTFAVASRSGILIVLGALFIYPFVSKMKQALKPTLVILFIISILCGSALYITTDKKGSLLTKLTHRVLTAASKKSAGNNIRVKIWENATKEWLQTNWLIGEMSGKYTNSTKNIKEKSNKRVGEYYIAESSLLQLLLNYGLIGTISFYGALLTIHTFIRQDHFWIKAGFFASIAETLVYQSVEVVPFMILLFLLPYFSQNFAYIQFSKRFDENSRHG